MAQAKPRRSHHPGVHCRGINLLGSAHLWLLRRWYGFALFPVRDLRDALNDRVDGDVVQRYELGDRVLEPTPTHVYPRCQCLSQHPQIIVHRIHPILGTSAAICHNGPLPAMAGEVGFRD